MVKKFWSSGEPFIWGTGAILIIVLILMFGLVGIVVYNGFGVFWPKEIVQFELKDGKKYLGEVTKTEYTRKKLGSVSDNSISPEKRIQIKRGNRDIDTMDFVWLEEKNIVNQSRPIEAVSIEREKDGNFIGFIKNLVEKDKLVPVSDDKFKTIKESVKVKYAAFKDKQKEIYNINNTIGKFKGQLKKIIYVNRQNGTKDRLDNDNLMLALPDIKPILYLMEAEMELQYLVGDNQGQNVIKKMVEQNNNYLVLKNELEFLEKDLYKEKIVLVDINGVEKTIPFSQVIRVIYPNQMGFISKINTYITKIYELIFDDPRESNTEGGLFPAILGTVMMVFLMSFLSFPLGVVSGVYLREYAKDGLFIRLVRIAVNNLAGIPSIVYGIFGLGFFVYIMGANIIDPIFYPEFISEPHFGKGGILWASLTLGILTVPVVIVSTEEALGSIPRDIRQGSLALGATKFQTLYGVLLPMASPGILTGFILAMSRAAGEVAPLMITGVVKFAPALPLDNDWPYLHLDRQFMHLGYQVYDVGFQSPNVEASTPMVYVTTLLLLIIVFSLSLVAIVLRNKMKKRYTVKSF